MLKVGIDINGKKPKSLNAYTSEIYEFREILDYKYKGWEEFVLTSVSKKLDKHFVKNGDKTLPVSKNLDLMRLTMFLDKQYPTWRRFTLTNRNFREIPCADCQAGMVIRQAGSNAYSYIFVESAVTNEAGHREVVGNKEGEKVTFSTKDRKKHKFNILAETVTPDKFGTLFAESVAE